ncbi:MAG: amidohydrolase family protein [Candidatus Jordarchaeales archaeon]
MKTIYCEFGLIGKELAFEENVYISFSKNGFIKDVSHTPPGGVNEEYVSCLVMPGLVNAHTHVGDSFFKEVGYNYSIDELVAPPHGLKHNLLDSVPEREIKEGIKWAAVEMLSSGTTTFADFREGGVRGALILRRALEDVPIKCLILGRDHTNIGDLLKVCDGVGLPSTVPYSDEELRMVYEECKLREAIISVHASETVDERERSLRMHGVTDVVRAVNILNADLLVHLTHVSDEELSLVSGRGVACCPRANAYLGVGIPPVEKMVEAGVKVCLGTDNVMINSPDLFREMDFLGKVVRARSGVRALSAKSILKMVTVNPAEVLKLNSGWIERGRAADIVIIDLEAPNVKPVHHPYQALVHRVKSENVVSVYVNGVKVHEK